MTKYTVAGFLAALALLCAGVVVAENDLLRRLDKRDKFYDLVQWGEEIWLVGHPGHILTSPDKGVSWKALPAPERAGIFAMDWFDEQTAIFCGMDGLLLRTTDRGKTITPVELNPDREEFKEKLRNPLFDIKTLRGSGEAWVVGHFLTILHTRDKGASWEFQEYILPEDQWDEPGLNAVDFVDSQHGWIVGEFATILRTVDGGKTWEKLPYPAKWASRDDLEVKDYPPLFSVTFLDTQTGIIAGSEGSLFITHDGGLTLKEQTTGTDKHLFFASHYDRTLHVAAQDGIILTGRIDEEGSWSAARQGVYVWLNSILYLDAQVGLAAGGRGTILRTTDGGTTWTQLSGR